MLFNCNRRLPQGTFKAACDDVKARCATRGPLGGLVNALYGSYRQYTQTNNIASKATCAACTSEKLGYNHGVSSLERRDAVCLTSCDLPNPSNLR